MLGRPRDLITHRAPACRWHAAAEEQAQCAGCGDVIAAGAASILAGGSREEARRPLARGLRGRPQAEPRREPARCLLRRGGAPQPAGQPVLARGGRGARGADDQPLPLLRVRAPARRQHQQHDPLSACHCKPPSRCSTPCAGGVAVQPLAELVPGLRARRVSGTWCSTTSDAMCHRGGRRRTQVAGWRTKNRGRTLDSLSPCTR